jgi:Kef-type K+ transport system membrane component KefB
VAFLLGNALTVEKLARHGREILIVTCALLAATLGIMAAGLTPFGLAPGSLILAAWRRPRTPPPRRTRSRRPAPSGPFTDRITGIVAVDDASGLIVFSLVLLVFVGGMGRNGASDHAPLAAPLRMGAGAGGSAWG